MSKWDELRAAERRAGRIRREMDLYVEQVMHRVPKLMAEQYLEQSLRACGCTLVEIDRAVLQAERTVAAARIHGQAQDPNNEQRNLRMSDSGLHRYLQ